MFKRHYIDGIEYPPSPICGGKPKFESNVTSFQFRQNAEARWWPIGLVYPQNGSWVLLTILRNSLYRGSLYRGLSVPNLLSYFTIDFSFTKD